MLYKRPKPRGKREIEIGDIFTYRFYHYAPRFKLNGKVGIILKEVKRHNMSSPKCYKTYCLNTNTIETVIEQNIF